MLNEALFPRAVYISLKLSLILSPPLLSVSPVLSLAVVPMFRDCLAITHYFF